MTKQKAPAVVSDKGDQPRGIGALYLSLEQVKLNLWQGLLLQLIDKDIRAIPRVSDAASVPSK